MARVPVDGEATGEHGAESEASGPRRRPDGSQVEVEIEREITKRTIVEAVTKVVIVVLYMVFTLFRDREAGVVVLDEKDGGPEDDWDEGS